MKSLITLVGIVLIILGVASLGYNGITYTKQEKVAQIGNVQVTADTEKTLYFPPYAGALALVGGIVLVMVGRR